MFLPSNGNLFSSYIAYSVQKCDFKIKNQKRQKSPHCTVEISRKVDPKKTECCAKGQNKQHGLFQLSNGDSFFVA